MRILRNVIISLDEDKNCNYLQLVSKTLTCDPSEIKSLQIYKKSLDARKRNRIKYIYSFLIDFVHDEKFNQLDEYKIPQPDNLPVKKIHTEPFIIGAGPAGIFSAISLVEKGFKPIIFDRGDSLENRQIKVADYWKNGNLDTETNVQFGEGGAGTFSDGKLTARNKNFYSSKVFDYLVKFGAKENIKYESLPHLGSDKLIDITKNIRDYLIQKGCTFHWNSKLNDIKISDGKLQEITINNDKYTPEVLILALGNSARDTFEMLIRKGLAIESKPFAVGFRLEHPVSYINDAFYGGNVDFDYTGPASYRLTYKSSYRGVYSFCMCPGGFVIPASSERNHTAINGMSYSHRNNDFSNSAIVVSVDQRDFGNNPMDGIFFQKSIEQKSFIGNVDIRTQKAMDFMKGQKSKQKRLKTSNLLNPVSENLNAILPPKITMALKKGLVYFDNYYRNFLSFGTLFASETRTSSPIRILRGKNFESINCYNVYPIGEGSGYSGGIVSSGADGYKLGQLFEK